MKAIIHYFQRRREIKLRMWCWNRIQELPNIGSDNNQLLSKAKSLYEFISNSYSTVSKESNDKGQGNC